MSKSFRFSRLSYPESHSSLHIFFISIWIAFLKNPRHNFLTQPSSLKYKKKHISRTACLASSVTGKLWLPCPGLSIFVQHMYFCCYVWIIAEMAAHSAYVFIPSPYLMRINKNVKKVAYWHTLKFMGISCFGFSTLQGQAGKGHLNPFESVNQHMNSWMISSTYHQSQYIGKW